MQSLVIGAEPIQFYSCFISYSHADKSFARRLHDALQGRGIRCWLDEHQLRPGDKIYTEVDRGIRLWDKVLLCCSKESLNSWWVENEIQIAFEKEQQLRKQRGQDVLALIPLNLDGYLFGEECKHGLAAQIRARLTADFTGWETDNSKFESEFEKLVKALRADAGGREQPPQPRL
ncbi:MAG: toll/interleukin-1 receptor domain-containing protein [Acidobacteriota bacterium]|nr:toll/interleukin-1 receptor domain-containing protein [Acidobacteriota bacterium]